MEGDFGNPQVPEMSREAMAARLQTMGYFLPGENVNLPSSASTNNAKLSTSAELSGTAAALKRLQRFYGLEQTGAPDRPTLAILEMPGCGNPDPIGPEELGAGSVGWPISDLTYSIGQMGGIVPFGVMRGIIEAACKVWSDASALTFRETMSQGHLRFSFGADEHGDGFPFDGEHIGNGGLVLAHAFRPDFPDPNLAGEVHFDSDERWSSDTICPPSRKDLLTVAIHEIGHALGLRHVGDTDSVMFRGYQGVRRKLASTDQTSIRSLYP